MNKLKLSSPILVLLLGCFSHANADTRMVFQNDGETSEMLIANNAIRMNVQSDEQDGYMLFNADDDSMTFVDDKKRSYMVFDKEMMEKMGNVVNDAMKQMEAQLAQMPAAQREQMKKMMSSMMPHTMSAEPVDFSYNRKGADKVAGYDCQVLEIVADGKKTSTLCVADPDELDIPSSDAAVFIAMRDFSMQMLESMPFARDMVQSYGEPGSNELPIRYAYSNDTIGQANGQLISINHDAIDSASLSVPAGYKREQMPDMGDISF